MDAVAELVSQDAATATERVCWSEPRNLFVAYYSGYRTPGLNPAVGRRPLSVRRAPPPVRDSLRLPLRVAHEQPHAGDAKHGLRTSQREADARQG